MIACTTEAPAHAQERGIKESPRCPPGAHGAAAHCELRPTGPAGRAQARCRARRRPARIPSPGRASRRGASSGAQRGGGGEDAAHRAPRAKGHAGRCRHARIPDKRPATLAPKSTTTLPYMPRMPACGPSDHEPNDPPCTRGREVVLFGASVAGLSRALRRQRRRPLVVLFGASVAGLARGEMADGAGAPAEAPAEGRCGARGRAHACLCRAHRHHAARRGRCADAHGMQGQRRGVQHDAGTAVHLRTSACALQCRSWRQRGKATRKLGASERAERGDAALSARAERTGGWSPARPSTRTRKRRYWARGRLCAFGVGAFACAGRVTHVRALPLYVRERGPERGSCACLRHCARSLHAESDGDGTRRVPRTQRKVRCMSAHARAYIPTSMLGVYPEDASLLTHEEESECVRARRIYVTSSASTQVCMRPRFVGG